MVLKKIYNYISISITKAWYQGSYFLVLLWPLAKIFEFIVTLRFKYFKKELRPGNQRAPVIIIGNITVGGSGKTPCIIALFRWLTQRGYFPGVVTRGYGGRVEYPYLVNSHSVMTQTGDEALLLYKELHCPLVIDPDRVRAVNYLLRNHPQVNIVLSDDGLQHYQLRRDYEIAVIDAQRGLGNEWCLPAGPLREPKSRLLSVDLMIAQGKSSCWPAELMQVPQQFVQIVRPYEKVPLNNFSSPVNAVAAIGNPERFFAMLRALGLIVIPHPFPDHYCFKAQDLVYNNQYPVIMTAKDAIKCEDFAKSHWYYLQVSPQFNEAAMNCLKNSFKGCEYE